MNRALFLDRDGVINVHKDYVYQRKDFEFMPGIFDLCRKYTDEGYLILIVTNQAGIAKGIYNEEDFQKLTSWMVKQFRKNGISISRIYHCPHHPDINGECECRKPAPGMMLQAIKDFNLDISECILIGDKETDIEAGRRAGIPEGNLIQYTAGADLASPSSHC